MRSDPGPVYLQSVQQFTTPHTQAPGGGFHHQGLSYLYAPYG